MSNRTGPNPHDSVPEGLVLSDWLNQIPAYQRIEFEQHVQRALHELKKDRHRMWRNSKPNRDNTS